MFPRFPCRYAEAQVIRDGTVKAKFHYASWFEAGSIKLVADLQRAKIWPII